MTKFFSFLFLFCVKLMYGSKYHYKRAIIGPPTKRHLNGVSLACRSWPVIECWLGSFMIFRGSGPVLLRNPIFVVSFRGVQTPCPPLPPLDHRKSQSSPYISVWPIDNHGCDTMDGNASVQSMGPQGFWGSRENGYLYSGSWGALLIIFRDLGASS